MTLLNVDTSLNAYSVMTYTITIVNGVLTLLRARGLIPYRIKTYILYAKCIALTYVDNRCYAKCIEHRYQSSDYA